MSAIFNKMLVFFISISCFSIFCVFTISADETDFDYSVHIMQKGETLWRLSISNYGTPRYAYLIAEYNKI
ncbi:TPA: hypothetical protein ENX78_09795, partial [Candidatus Poribacteria bacterium]|nr:hypothetical protein [Candidatus Poribacteria bacterium]